MKKIFFATFALAVLLVGLVQPVQASFNIQGLAQQAFVGPDQIKMASPVAQLNAAASKFEGLLDAYSVNGKQNTEKQLFTAASDLSTSLNEFNAVLSEVYPDLTEEEQLVIEEAYSQIGVYLEQLAAKANSVFGREVFRIEYKDNNIYKDNKILDFIDAISF
ncbi:hypothetical protein A3F08_03525 [Candidatus Berkelbacteria bacterium RIFCSPHIGHO2_12_FULL_36_9]|uniref:DUF5667 domain-containing protein n=1 Tax=Candidatus Berkelbacteria bacterium RIFCSPHIGHO2_12_FULL_36_9 TaxID=1797469 RepID=A0A1F5EKI7_9BACT|nr:MAG: hypothetical protein A3F08_03525 [Candidatus Berkelbacteria bacterium RIFCSPHIGHO2_12_FULL_36_9]